MELSEGHSGREHNKVGITLGMFPLLDYVKESLIWAHSSIASCSRGIWYKLPDRSAFV